MVGVSLYKPPSYIRSAYKRYTTRSCLSVAQVARLNDPFHKFSQALRKPNSLLERSDVFWDSFAPSASCTPSQIRLWILAHKTFLQMSQDCHRLVNLKFVLNCCTGSYYQRIVINSLCLLFPLPTMWGCVSKIEWSPGNSIGGVMAAHWPMNPCLGINELIFWEVYAISTHSPIWSTVLAVACCVFDLSQWIYTVAVLQWLR